MKYTETEIDNIATDIAITRGMQERRDAIKKLITDLQTEPVNIFSSNALLSDELKPLTRRQNTNGNNEVPRMDNILFENRMEEGTS